MLKEPFFYFGTIRKLLYAFGSIFSDIVVVRSKEDDHGTVIDEQVIRVPIAYGPKQKWVTMATQDPEYGLEGAKPISTVVPRLAFEITSLSYDSDRKLISVGDNVRLLSTSDNKQIRAQYNPVPYAFGIDLHILVKNYEDQLIIIEQIMPFFKPDFTIAVKDIVFPSPVTPLTKDIPVVLNSVSPSDTYEGSMEDTRLITCTLSFTMKGYIYPPVKPKNVILDVNLQLIEDLFKEGWY